MYSLLSDIFFNQYNIFLKPHPGDLSNYEIVFSNQIIIDREMPSELIKFIMHKKFDDGICTYTTSIDSLKAYINNVYEFDDTIVEFKDIVFKLYFLYEIAKELNFSINMKETTLSKNLEKLYNLDGKNNIYYEINAIDNESIIVKNNYFFEANIIVEIKEKFPNYYKTPNYTEKLYMKVNNEKLKNYILKFKKNIEFKLSKCPIEITAYNTLFLEGK